MSQKYLAGGPETEFEPGSRGRVLRNRLGNYRSVNIGKAGFRFAHPFCDGNGRLARLLALLMALQAGLPPLAFLPLANGTLMPSIAE